MTDSAVLPSQIGPYRNRIIGLRVMTAGEQIGRLVYGMELQPMYVAAILERLAGMGLKPVLAEGE